MTLPHSAYGVEASSLPVDVRPRCTNIIIDRAGNSHQCNQLLAEYAGRPWKFTCRRCKGVVQSAGWHPSTGILLSSSAA